MEGTRLERHTVLDAAVKRQDPITDLPKTQDQAGTEDGSNQAVFDRCGTVLVPPKPSERPVNHRVISMNARGCPVLTAVVRHLGPTVLNTECRHRSQRKEEGHPRRLPGWPTEITNPSFSLVSFQRVLDLFELRVEGGLERSEAGDDADAEDGGDQAVFDRRGARTRPSESGRKCWS